MAWLRRNFQNPASTSQMGLVIAVCIVALSIMSVALVWQAGIISSQREAIQWLAGTRLGG